MERKIIDIAKEREKEIKDKKKFSTFIFLKIFIQISLIVIIIASSLIFANQRMIGLSLIEQEIIYTQSQINMALDRQEQLADLHSYINSIEFIESTARARLGLVYPDEIIFILNEGHND